MDELISVIIPVYNVEKYLKICLESVLNQTYQNLEIILVDDGSKDKSGQICDEYSKKDERIKVIHKENGGLSDARNVGIENSFGKYICFIDSDDYIDVKFLENLYSIIKKYNADISVCCYKIVSENSDHLKVEEKREYSEEVWNNEQSYKELLLFGKLENYIWNKLFKKSLFNGVCFPKGKKMEDIGTTYLLLDKAKKIATTNYVGYFYMQREGSIMSNLNEQLIVDTKEMINIRFNYLKKKYPNLFDELMINRLAFIKFYYEDIGKINKLGIMKDFDEEYKFYKENYKKYRKKVKETSKSNIRKVDFDILYINKNLLVNINKIKIKIKKIREKKYEKNSNNNISWSS